MAHKENTITKPKYDYLGKTAYEIRDSKFGVFPVRKTANAWWNDRTKVEKIIDGKKMLEKDEFACNFAGITKRQLDYFLEVHPHFCDFFSLLPMDARTRARITIYNDLDNIETAKWYAKYRMSDEFNPNRLVPTKSTLDENPYRDMTEEELTTELEKVNADILCMVSS